MKNTTILYRTTESAVICSLELSHRTGSLPALSIISPHPLLTDSIFKINSASTSHNLFLHCVAGGSLVDCVNAIAKCLLTAKTPCETIVGAAIGDSFMLFSPSNNTIKYLYVHPFTDIKLVNDLKSACLEKYTSILQTLS